MAMKEKFTMEYGFRSAPSLLYSFVTQPSAMAQWFADFVDATQEDYLFRWDNAEDKATLIEDVEDELVRYEWEHADEGEYFEFKIQKDDVTGGTALIITDFAEKGDLENAQLLWDSQIKTLVERVGG
jgi:uncharacterized protein YndB with AHSA1/START domain